MLDDFGTFDPRLMVTHCRLVLEVQFYHTDSVSEDERPNSASPSSNLSTSPGG
jgi:hypothetical protein